MHHFLRKFVVRQPDSSNEVDYIQSAIQFREQRYLPVQAILSSAMLDYLKIYYQILLANRKFVKDDQCPLSLSLAGDPALDAVLEWIRPGISRLVGTDLVPTYSYTRIYAQGDLLAPHIDRPSCEISLSAAVKIPQGMRPSTLFLKPPNAAEVRVEMREGDGCLYAGSEVEHWREPFQHEGYIQLFLHYIARHGKNFPEYEYDQRSNLGAQTKKWKRTDECHF